MNVMTPGMHSM